MRLQTLSTIIKRFDNRADRRPHRFLHFICCKTAFQDGAHAQVSHTKWKKVKMFVCIRVFRIVYLLGFFLCIVFVKCLLSCFLNLSFPRLAKWNKQAYRNWNNNKRKYNGWLIDWLILTECQTVKSYFMTKG